MGNLYSIYKTRLEDIYLEKESYKDVVSESEEYKHANRRTVKQPYRDWSIR